MTLEPLSASNSLFEAGLGTISIVKSRDQLDNSTIAPSSAAGSFAESGETCRGVKCFCSRCEGRWQVWKDAVGLAARYPTGYRDLHCQENQWSAQIRLDTRRTFPEFHAFGADEEQCLFRLLNAYANHNPALGYCQGMNFVAGLLILVSGCDEEDAFGVFVCLMDHYGLAGFYEESFSLLLQYVRACDSSMSEVSPALKNHLDEQGLHFFLYLHEWLLTLFINCLPIPYVLAIWDVVMQEGLHVLISASVSILQALETTILSLRFEDIYELFKSLKCPEPAVCGGSVQGFQFRWLMDRSCYTEIPPKILRSLGYVCCVDKGPARRGFRASFKRVFRHFSLREQRCDSEEHSSLSMIATVPSPPFEPQFASVIDAKDVTACTSISHAVEEMARPVILCENQRTWFKGKWAAPPELTTADGVAADEPPTEAGFVISRFLCSHLAPRGAAGSIAE